MCINWGNMFVCVCCHFTQVNEHGDLSHCRPTWSTSLSSQVCPWMWMNTGSWNASFILSFFLQGRLTWKGTNERMKDTFEAAVGARRQLGTWNPLYDAKSIVSYLAQQTPGVFTKVWADGSQQQSLSLYELEDEVSVHSLNSQLTILIFGCLQTHTKTVWRGRHHHRWLDWDLNPQSFYSPSHVKSVTAASIISPQWGWKTMLVFKI